MFVCLRCWGNRTLRFGPDGMGLKRPVPCPFVPKDQTLFDSRARVFGDRSRRACSEAAKSGYFCWARLPGVVSVSVPLFSVYLRPESALETLSISLVRTCQSATAHCVCVLFYTAWKKSIKHYFAHKCRHTKT